MKTKTKKRQAMIALFGLLTAIMILAIAVTPAMAASPHLDGSVIAESMVTPVQLDKVRSILDSLIPSGVDSGAAEVPGLDDRPIPDGGGWEPCFPEDVEDDAAAPEGTDEAVDETVDEGAGEAVDEAADEAVDEGADEAVDEQCDEDDTDGADEATGEDATECGDNADDEAATDEAEGAALADEQPQPDEPQAEEPQPEGPQGDDDQNVGLPFTGGNSIPWVIAGAAVVLAGLSMLARRRSRDENR